jgi:S-DNA-T family DNA segregation ATPase FtsK/SpoIIIE
MMMMGAVGIAAQHPPAGPQACRFYMLDGSPVDSALSGQLGKLKDVLPHPVTNVTWRDLGAVYTGIAAEIKRRQESASDDQAPVYIFIYDIQRFRDLRKSDDDFGYTRYDEDKPIPPAKLFSDILRDGPPNGVHTIIWCDSVNNMNRTLDRQGMKEFENRILFQMSANDSSTLIDTPAGSKLGENRALYYSEEANRIEKFRPYGVPEAEWLDSVKKRFAARPAPATHAHQPDGTANGASAPLDPAGAAGNGDASVPHNGAPVTTGAPDEDLANPPVDTL